ncbi:MAG: DNA double-strand break repair nuclease NurA [Nitrosopumilus sp.]|nr:DNA double-strand break repair nuclease NurA [Nitrosopumilus sp.]
MTSILKDKKFDDITKKAKENWITYAPTKKKSNLFGIDSSFNTKKYQGLFLWATDVISINIKNETRAREFKVGLGRENEEISKQAAKMEIDACEQTTDHADYVLMDGSLYSHFTSKLTPLRNVKGVLTKNNNVVFIGKTSNSRKQFEKYDSIAGDIFYYNHAVRKTGFSKLFVDSSHGHSQLITSTYARLSEDTPLMKIELMGGDHTENDIKKIMDALLSESVGGYPRSLKMAHNECKISSANLENLVHVLGLTNEIGSRDLLE